MDHPIKWITQSDGSPNQSRKNVSGICKGEMITADFALPANHIKDLKGSEKINILNFPES